MYADRHRIVKFNFLLSYKRRQFLLVCKISTNATTEFGNRYFKDIHFLDPLQTVGLGLLSYLVVRIINHMVVFLPYFPFPSSFFMTLWRCGVVVSTMRNFIVALWCSGYHYCTSSLNKA